MTCLQASAYSPAGIQDNLSFRHVNSLPPGGAAVSTIYLQSDALTTFLFAVSQGPSHVPLHWRKATEGYLAGRRPRHRCTTLRTASMLGPFWLHQLAHVLPLLQP